MMKLSEHFFEDNKNYLVKKVIKINAGDDNPINCHRL